MENRHLKDYTWIVNSDVPWKHMAKDLTQVKVALITTAGLYTWKTQKYFNLGDENGDSSFREIKKEVVAGDLRVSHRFVDLKSSVGLDYNCIFPLDVLKELEKEKRINSVSEIHFSVMGEIKDPKELIEDTVPKIIKQLQKYLVDVVIISPAGPLGHQTAAIMARLIEEAEISTIMLTSLQSVCSNIKPPRALLLRFPFGMLFGAPFDARNQKEILNECLVHIKSIREPGEIVEIGFHWKESFKSAMEAKPDLKKMMSTGAVYADGAK